MDPYATHLEPLLKAALESKGDLLELGCGDYSTPLLSRIARSRGDELIVYTSSPEWGSRFRDLALLSIVDWANWKLEGLFGMIFLDNEEHQPTRSLRIPELMRHAPIVVMHDADEAMTYPEFRINTNGFKVELYDKHRPNTVTITKC
jgi:hypothetical protein